MLPYYEIKKYIRISIHIPLFDIANLSVIKLLTSHFLLPWSQSFFGLYSPERIIFKASR